MSYRESHLPSGPPRAPQGCRGVQLDGRPQTQRPRGLRGGSASEATAAWTVQLGPPLNPQAFGLRAFGLPPEGGSWNSVPANSYCARHLLLFFFFFKRNEMPWPLSVVVGVLSHKPKACGFSSRAGHTPELRVWSPLGESARGNQLTLLSPAPSLSLSPLHLLSFPSL